MKLVLVLSATAVLTAGFFLACGNDGPTAPSGPRDYTVYLANLASGNILAYQPTTGDVDSFIVGMPLRMQFPASADGRRLYLGRDSVVAFDVSTHAQTAVWPTFRWGVAVSPDNRVVAVSGGGTTVLRTSDYTVTFHDTTTLGGLAFSADSRTLYGVFVEHSLYDGQVYRARLDVDSVLPPKKFPNRYVAEVLPSPDGTKWFLNSMRYVFTWAFTVYSVADDAVIFDTLFSPGMGSISMTPDGRYVFFTNPGNLIGWGDEPPSPCNIAVYDVAENRVCKVISATGKYGSDTADAWMPVGRMSITPDGRWLVTTSTWSGRVAVVDISQLEIVRRDKFGDLSELVPFSYPNVWR
jgi:WD40 repeat protein